MKSLYLTVILFVCISFSVIGQNISVIVGDEPNGLSGAVFPIQDGVLSVSANKVSLGEDEFYSPHSWSVSPDNRKISFLVKGNVFEYQLFDSDGSAYFKKDLEFFDLQDETAKNYQFDDGRSVLRDNVANFSFYSPSGKQLYSISNSTQSTGGERASELVSDKNGKTVVLYNPVVNYGNVTGSRASVISKDRTLNTFFRDREREIRSVQVTPSGTYISVIVEPASDSNEYTALIYDRFGNKISEITTEEELKGIELNDNGDFVTLFSSGRMQVYRLEDLERIGSASSRSSILHATYDPEENMIVAMGGTVDGYRIMNPSITAVHIGQRIIASEKIDESLYIINSTKIRLKKEDNQQYSVHNLNRSVRINTTF